MINPHPPFLGVDLGGKRTGLALSENGILAHPFTVLEAKPPHLTTVINEMVEIIKKQEIATLIIGIPFTQDEALTSQALKVESVIEQLGLVLKQHHLDTAIVRVNEFHSTIDAKQLYPGVEIDAASATLLLQDYIDQITPNSWA